MTPTIRLSGQRMYGGHTEIIIEAAPDAPRSWSAGVIARVAVLAVPWLDADSAAHRCRGSTHMWNDVPVYEFGNDACSLASWGIATDYGPLGVSLLVRTSELTRWFDCLGAWLEDVAVFIHDRPAASSVPDVFSQSEG